MFNLNYILDKNTALNMNSLVLAYIGDAVYELFYRYKIASNCDATINQQHNNVNLYVNAKYQAKLFDNIKSILTDEELLIYKRARNYKKKTRAKHSSIVEYNMSTGIEAVIGYLYITGNINRINDLLNVEL